VTPESAQVRLFEQGQVCIANTGYVVIPEVLSFLREYGRINLCDVIPSNWGAILSPLTI
jgi:hypothetical protein